MTALHKSKPRPSQFFAAFFLIMSFLFYAAPPGALAEEPTPEPTAPAGDIPQASGEFYVNDAANLLSEATKAAILAKNAELNESFGAQIVVYTTTALPVTGYVQRVEYLRRLMDGWQVGGAGGNGLLIAVSTADQDYLAVAGNGLKGAFTTQALKDLLNAQLEPDFSAGAYDAGLSKFFTAAADKAEAYLAAGGQETAPNAASQAPVRSRSKKKGRGPLFWVGISAGCVAVASLLVFVLAGRISATRRSRRTVHRRSSMIYPSRTTVMHRETRPTVQIKYSKNNSHNSYRTQKQSHSRSNIDWRQ